MSKIPCFVPCRLVAIAYLSVFSWFGVHPSAQQRLLLLLYKCAFPKKVAFDHHIFLYYFGNGGNVYATVPIYHLVFLRGLNDIKDSKMVNFLFGQQKDPCFLCW